jgi:hypothetical protein
MTTQDHKNIETETLITLKYEFMPTFPEDVDEWKRIYNTYPKEVTWAWNWRCAEDVEHLATTESAKECIAYAKTLKDKKGDITNEELVRVTTTHHTACTTTSSAYAAVTSATTATACAAVASVAAHTTVAATNASAAYVAYTVAVASERQGRWTVYQGWLKEMLAAYENQRSEQDESQPTTSESEE